LRTFVRLSNPHISKTTNFIFSQNSHTKQCSYAVVHRQPWPCANPSEFKTFVHQEFHGIHLGRFVGLSNPHISKTTNFIFSQNSPPSSLAMPWCTDNLGHVQTLQTQNFRAPTISWYSFGDICRPFQPSRLKNHEFHFFTKLPTKPYSYAAVHRPTWPSPNSIQFKTFVHQDFYSTHYGTFVGLSNLHIARTTDFIFSQKSPPSHLPMPWCTANPGHLHNHPNSKLSCTKIFMVFIWGHSLSFPTLSSQKQQISFFHKTPHQAV